ncbi:hypothetical protein L6260_01845 [Candidatus Parcubacteria bacterium]|nr:hypothetical protein [Patescibacteria group bacterium]MCG2687524.1 hypothetical protein [Candidatus Parcubacteria bacterium]
MKRVLIFFLVISASMFFAISPAKALTIEEQYQNIREQGIIFSGICANSYDPCACRDTGDCQLSDLLQLLVNISSFILAISGSAIMLIIVYVGMKWILSPIDAKMVSEGKDAIIGGVIGLAIILGAYATINVIVSVLKTGDIPTTNLETTVGDGANSIIETQ